jgi:hypothetical protein
VDAFGIRAIHPRHECRGFSRKARVKRSRGQTDKREAIKVAKHLYEQLVFNRLNGVAMMKKSRFDACANGMMEMQAARVARKEISAAAHRNDQYFLDAKILPELRELDVAEITYDTLERRYRGQKYCCCHASSDRCTSEGEGHIPAV